MREGKPRMSSEAQVREILQLIFPERTTVTPYQQDLVRNSFKKVVPISETAATLFYGRLFELNPKLRPLFKGDMKEQGRKLIAMLAMVIADIHQINKLVPAVRDLGRRHATYGVVDSDYLTVADALLWTLERGLGSDFTAPTKEAWATCYFILAEEMKAAAREQHAPLLPPC
jgi:hemoglobin-like flavoprotein